MLNGTEIARGDGDFEFYDIKSFGDWSCLEDEVPFILDALSNFYDTELSLLQQNTLSRYTGWNLITDPSTSNDENSFSTLVVDECIPKGCYNLSLQPLQGDPQERFCTSAFRGQIYYNATYEDGSIVSTGISNDPFCQQSYKFGECSTTTSP